MNRLAVGLAVGAGYVLGRTKKAKFAFAVGSMVAGKKLHLSPKALGALVNQQLQNNPQFKEIGDQLREDLRGVGKAATGSLVNRQLEGLADRLHDRTQGVQDRLSGVVPDDVEDTAKGATKGRIGGRDEREEDEGHAEHEEGEEREEGADAESEGPQRRRKAPAKKTSAASAGKPAAKSAAKSAPKAAAKKAPARRSQGAKSAQGGTRKKTAAARGAARGAASSARTGSGRTKGDRDHD